MSKLTSGRCNHCQRGNQIPLVYQWKAGKGRRLFNAYCPRCDNLLDQTCVSNMKRVHVFDREPVFKLREWEVVS